MMASLTAGAAQKTIWLLDRKSSEPHPSFFYIECVCNAWFTFEILTRFAVSHNRLLFVRTPVNVVDLIATVSFYLDFVMTRLKRDNDVLEFFRLSSHFVINSCYYLVYGEDWRRHMALIGTMASCKFASNQAMYINYAFYTELLY